MAIKVSNLPNLTTPIDTTVLMATDYQTATNSVKITVANLRSYIVTPTLTHASKAYGEANSAYIAANTAANTANAGFIQANSGFAVVNSVYDFANTINSNLANTVVALNASYSNSNSIYVYAQSVHSSANAAAAVAANSFIQANASFIQANLSFNLATTANNTAESALSIASSALQQAQESNVNSTIALSNASDALTIASDSEIKSQQAYDTANSSLYLVSNTSIKLESAYSLANTNSIDIAEIQTTLNNEKLLNVLNFGAIGDGFTNDTIAIQTAINFSNSTTVHFPVGVYICDNITLRPGVSLVGDGSNSTFLLANTSNTTIFGYQTNLQEEGNFNISNMSLGTNGSANCVGINISGTNSLIMCNKIRISNINIEGSSGSEFESGVKLNYCKNYFINNNYFSGNKNDIFLRQTVKGQINSNISESDANNYNIFEATGSNTNIIMGNVLRKSSYIVGSGSIKVNNLENLN